MPRGRFLRRARAGSPSRRTGRSARGCRGQAARARIARPLRGGVLFGVASRSRRPLIPSPGDAYRRGQPFVPRVLPPCLPWLRRVRPARGPFPPRGGEAPRPSGVPWLPAPLCDVLSSSRDSSTLALERPKIRQTWRFAILDGKPERRRRRALSLVAHRTRMGG